ncbi:alpha-hydroxy-acid oxidizing protein [Streptomyces sp. G44]|uniref:alpha-hydroxy acid oxidase n=1 Tax=Streptomyces sp. G44 TaxID=2807632 RepID=UPI00196183EC|nr:alpha-hydroxy acid oxidase [Streptomyces sp. G44]MBM7169128.1 alpha-hydroxy-acid oxidizing protein [Streptomyces sp. G44]
MRLTLGDFEEAARSRLAPAVWDFFEGGAGEERTLAANAGAFDRLWLRPRVLRGAVHPETATTILGRSWDAPVAVAPLGYHTLAHPLGELATVRGTAAAARVPVVISTFAGRGIEEIAAAADGGPLWLQVYCLRDRAMTRRLIERAEGVGCEALVLTVDTPHMGRRLRDLRNGFRLPAGIVPANLEGHDFTVPAAHAAAEFAPLDWSVVEWLRSVSALPVLLKGILTDTDAARAVEAGADGIVVSNHGGRQLDGVPATLDALPEIVTAVDGRVPVLLDGGVRRGRDVLAALALGADAVLVGRPVLHGLAVDGAQGVTDVLNILLGELTDAMGLAGLSELAGIGPGLVRPAAGAEERGRRHRAREVRGAAG